ncbi:type II toxin-antitoxin system PemK/MazF family toxin [Sciscionella marina]|uniref:type II toxin-antitoxin system PemK/MazF family toxin n=1 Tax=Sciscionella marina TaxID=508770 RepID=UPI00035D27F3|nr:type II toxin-antitoxin system PemK/MazF family toxin [Sciscionella marina]
MTAPLRGQVYWADLGYGRKPWLIISNNGRNRRLSDVLAVRVTTTPRELPTWVPLTHEDPVTGMVNTDNIETLSKDELGDYAGTLCSGTLMKVNNALLISLAIPR